MVDCEESFDAELEVSDVMSPVVVALVVVNSEDTSATERPREALALALEMGLALGDVTATTVAGDAWRV